LGQFHPDFDEINGQIPTATESYFIGKKLYLDHLRNDDGVDGWHVRGKVLTKKSIAKQAERVGGYLNLYDMLYNGKVIEFDLVDGMPSFKHNKDFTISSRQHFIRKVCGKLSKGTEPENIQ